MSNQGSDNFFGTPGSQKSGKQPLTNPFGINISNIPNQNNFNQHDDYNESFDLSYDYSNQQNISFNNNPQQSSNNQPKQPIKNPFFNNNPSFSQDDFQGNISLSTMASTSYDANYNVDPLNEPPLLEDLGIDLDNIKNRTISVLLLKKCDEKFIQEADMSGPLLLAFLFGTMLMLSGKIHFGNIYGFGVSGCLGLYLIINFLSQHKFIKLYNTVSILGYCLLPIVILSAFNLFIDLRGFIGVIFSVIAILWSTFTSTTFFEEVLNLEDRKWLVAYPTGLFYSTFVLITIF